jgi:hypothetical protein
MGMIALFLASVTTYGERVAGAFLGFVHLLLAPPLLALGSASAGFGAPQEALDRAVPRTPDVAAATVVLVNPPNDGCSAILVASRLARGEPRPRFVLPLAGTTSEVEVVRTDERTLRVTPAHGFLEHTIDRNWRSLERPMRAGSTVELSRMTATVVDSTSDLRPAEAIFRFDAPLEDPSFVWLRFSHGEFVPWIPPRIGERSRLAASGAREVALELLDGSRVARVR